MLSNLWNSGDIKAGDWGWKHLVPTLGARGASGYSDACSTASKPSVKMLWFGAELVSSFLNMNFNSDTKPLLNIVFLPHAHLL